MQKFMRDVQNWGRRLCRRRPQGGAVVAGRWLALCLLIAGVAAAGVWGNAGGANVTDVAGVAGVSADLPVDFFTEIDVNRDVGADLGKKNTAPLADNANQPGDTACDTADIDDMDAANDTVDDDTDEVSDGAPEPWVGDAVLQAEADLLGLQPPLADWGGDVLRAFGFGYDASFKDYRFHNGTDWQAAEGMPVLAALDGEVAELTADAVYGAGLVISCGDKLDLVYRGITPKDVQVGQAVAAGDVLGQVATSPVFEDAYPAHLHMEIWLDGAPVDAAGYLHRLAE